MRFTYKFFLTSVLTAAALLAQGPPEPHLYGPGPGGPHGPGGPGLALAVPPVAGAPFAATGTMTHQQTLADGNQITETHTAQVYRDAQGRTRTEATMTSPSGTTKTMVTIVDPVAGFMAHLDAANSTAMKAALPPHPPSGNGPPAPPADDQRPQPLKTDLGSSSIAGVAATGTRYTMTIPAGAMGNSEAITETREVWASSALKMPVKVVTTSPLRGTTTMQLSNVSQSAPEESLFQIPSSYAVKAAPAHRGPGGPDGPPPPPDAGN